jgi:hypothetical protein
MNTRLRMTAAALAGAAMLAAGSGVPAAAMASAPSARLAVSVSGLPRHPALTLGGAPLTFTVTVRNRTARVYRHIRPVVAIDHCACSANPIREAPLGWLQEFNPATGKWRTVQYDMIGGGTDFMMVVQQPQFSLAPGQARSFKFRVAFLPQSRQLIRYHSGPTGITVVVVPDPDPSFKTLASTDVPVWLLVR